MSGIIESQTVQSAMNEEGNQLFVGRQPILDAAGNLFGYEILFRTSDANLAIIKDDTQATSRVIINALNSIGVNKLIGKKKGFINFNSKMLLSESYDLLDAENFVIEILESITLNDEVIGAIKKAKEKGYQIALDDFDMSEEMIKKFDLIKDYLDYLKIDMMQIAQGRVEQALALVGDCDIKLLGEKVEDERTYHYLLENGFTFFQGYFFARPEVLKEKSIDPTLTSIMDVITQLQRNQEVPFLEEVLKKNPSVTVNLLKFINSASVGLRNEISSIRQAITLIGAPKLKQWLMMMVYAKPGVSMGDSTTLHNAAQRGKIMELLCQKMSLDKGEVAFLTGIMSHLDAVYQIPMEVLLPELHIDAEITEAVLQGKGKLGALLTLMQAMEDQNAEKMHAILVGLNLPEADLAEVSLEAYKWMEKVF